MARNLIILYLSIGISYAWGNFRRMRAQERSNGWVPCPLGEHWIILLEDFLLWPVQVLTWGF